MEFIRCEGILFSIPIFTKGEPVPVTKCITRHAVYSARMVIVRLLQLPSK
jgi:hypothetical protein